MLPNGLFEKSLYLTDPFLTDLFESYLFQTYKICQVGPHPSRLENDSLPTTILTLLHRVTLVHSRALHSPKVSFLTQRLLYLHLGSTSLTWGPKGVQVPITSQGKKKKPNLTHQLGNIAWNASLNSTHKNLKSQKTKIGCYKKFKFFYHLKNLHRYAVTYCHNCYVLPVM